MKTWTINNMGNSPIAKGDTVIFFFQGKEIKYTVNSNHLASDKGNGVIFYLLKLNIFEFASKAYKYPAVNIAPENWPECALDDMKALSRLVRALYEEIDDQEIKSVPVERLIEEKAVKPYQYGKGDHVQFHLDGTTYDFNIVSTHLSGAGCYNGILFDVFHLDEEQKENWASMHYGYSAKSGEWPESKPNDYAALNRFIIDIRRVIKDVNYLIDQEDYDISDINIIEIIRGKIGRFDSNKLNTPWRSTKLKKSPTNSSSNNQLNQLTNGNTIKVSRLTPSIRRGEKKRGCIVRGKTGRTTIKFGYLSNGTISG